MFFFVCPRSGPSRASRRFFFVQDLDKTEKGDRTVVLYSTQLGESKNFGLHAAAVCPKKGEGKLGACEKTYFDMLGKAEY